ncbi:hypothetical protein [Lactobacillus sp. ESL0228]|uniref:hypothetical protein n=1 Tax=Lactobacillus sp. ESL0228 TaxID=2069352 RepID=UPI000EFA74D3|nr:hypothetical protein [Lactobacillus sp. ESL0228]RMC49615.1 hypothetical protein F5ESL0228_02505 [Lactobacillus sp. ESL0228]
MSKYNKTILTNAGLDLAARASSGKAKFTITRAATSTEKLADKSISELQKLTTLPSLMQYGEINNVADSAQDKNIVIGTELIFNNKDLTTSYNVNTIGLFAKEDGSDKEILYALTTAVEPETMPDFKDKVLFKFNMTMFVVVGQTDNVSVNVTDNGVVTQQQLSDIVAKLSTKDDLAKVRKDSNDLAVLTNPDSIVSNQTINLDTFTTKGITKFQNAQLSSAGYMQAFDQSTTGLNGWIFNIYSNDAASYIQIVHITNTTYNQGAMYFLRTKANGTSTEDFARLSTVKDHAQFFPLTQRDAKEVIARDENKSFNPDNVVGSGVHRISSTKIIAKYDVTDPKDPNSGYSFSGYYWGWLFNFNFDDTPDSNAVYQLLLVNSGMYYREISVKTGDFPAFNSFSFAKDIAKLQTAIANAGSIKTIGDKKPDDKGNINLSSFENPDFVYKYKDTLDVDKATTPGIYSLMDTTLTCSINTNALSAVPRNTDGTTYTGYLVVYKHDAANITQELRIYTGRTVPDFTISTRGIYGNGKYRPNFQRLAATPDLQNLQSQITTNYQNTMKTWVGTLEQYQSMATHEPMTVYYIISDYEVVVK